MSGSNIDDSIPSSTDVNMSVTCIEVSTIWLIEIFQVNLFSNIHTVLQNESKGTQRNNHENSISPISLIHMIKGQTVFDPRKWTLD